jgi:polyisoprenoid-binding protein YceI
MKTTSKWVIDPAHSEILFRVKHMMITNVKGEFRKFTAAVSTENEDFIHASILASVDASSVFTNDDDRDNHLRSADFFDVEKYKEIVFSGTSFTKLANGNYELTGILTIKGVSKEIKLESEFGGINRDPWGNLKAGFSLSGKINRKDWNLTWNAALETGGVLVSDEVRIEAEVQLVKQA